MPWHFPVECDPVSLTLRVKNLFVMSNLYFPQGSFKPFHCVLFIWEISHSSSAALLEVAVGCNGVTLSPSSSSQANQVTISALYQSCLGGSYRFSCCGGALHPLIPSLYIQPEQLFLRGRIQHLLSFNLSWLSSPLVCPKLSLRPLYPQGRSQFFLV